MERAGSQELSGDHQAAETVGEVAEHQELSDGRPEAEEASSDGGAEQQGIAGTIRSNLSAEMNGQNSYSELRVPEQHCADSIQSI